MPDSMQEFKGDAFYEHLKEQTASRERYPLKGQWEITCRCNLKCVMCYTDCFNTPRHIAQELSTSEILRIMDELRDAGVLELALTGGEPMARMDFKEIYIHAIQSGFLTEVFTNGTYIDEDWIRVWQEYRPHGIEISFHGFQPATFDQITAIPGSYGRVMKGIKLVLENRLPLTLKTTGLDLNYKEILQIKSWAKSLDQVKFRFGSRIRGFANGDDAPKQFQLGEDRLESLFAQDSEFQSDYLSKQENSEKPSCRDARRQFHIDAYGNLQLCSGNRLESYSLKTGNFKEGYYQVLPSFPCPRKKQNSGLYQITTPESVHESVSA